MCVRVGAGREKEANQPRRRDVGVLRPFQMGTKWAMVGGPALWIVVKALPESTQYKCVHWKDSIYAIETGSRPSCTTILPQFVIRNPVFPVLMMLDPCPGGTCLSPSTAAIKRLLK